MSLISRNWMLRGIVAGLLAGSFASVASAAALNAVAGNIGSAVAVGDGRIIFSNNLHLAWFPAAGSEPTVNYTGVAVTPSGYVAVASDGSVWTSTNPTGAGFILRQTPTTHGLRAIETIGSRLLAVGDDGVILRSSSLEGTGWVAQSSGVSASLRAIANNASFTVVVGDGGIILRGSVDGTGFERIDRDDERDLLDICVNADNRTFLAVGRGGAMFRANADASTWTEITGVTTSTLHACATNGLPYGTGAVVVGDGGIAFFSQGNFSNWNEANANSTEDLLGLSFTGVDFVAVGENRETLKSVTGFIGWENGVVPTRQTSWGVVKRLYETKR